MHDTNEVDVHVYVCVHESKLVQHKGFLDECRVGEAYFGLSGWKFFVILG